MRTVIVYGLIFSPFFGLIIIIQNLNLHQKEVSHKLLSKVSTIIMPPQTHWDEQFETLLMHCVIVKGAHL